MTTAGSIESLTLQQFKDMLDIDLIGVFLASDESALATGAEFVVDGGSSL